ncbi:hypothetical protein TSMEX_010927 [Taenia solium]|eukprot:TsM_000755100 transcript=TsM_000755100 gene=TsM_000755100
MTKTMILYKGRIGDEHISGRKRYLCNSPNERSVLVSGPNTIIFKDTDEYDLRGKCNALILLADVIENHEIVFDNAPLMIFECVLPQLSVGNQSLQGSAAYCLGVLLRHMDWLDYISVSNCCDILLDFLCDLHDDVTISQNALVVEKILAAKVDKKDEPVYKRTSMRVLDGIFRASKQLCRPFPLQLFTDCVIAYSDRLKQSKMFSRERAPAEILQGMLILTRRILKKGFPHAELVECGAMCWSKATAYSHALIDTNIRKVFRITIPLIIDTLLRAKNPTNFLGEQGHARIRDETIRVQGFPELLLLGEPAWTALAQKISVWFPLLRDLDQQNVVRRLSETFENGYKSLELSRSALDGEAAFEVSEKSSQSIGAERLASFVAEQLITLPVKLEVPVSTLFFKSDAFRVNFLRMVTLVVRLKSLFLNRTCLNRFVEIVVCLLTDSRCEASGNVLDLLRVLNTCLLMADEIGLSQAWLIVVTPHIVERICATKASWMYAQRSTIKTTSCLLLEEVCVLGMLLMFGEGPSGLYMNITPFKTKDAEEFYCPIFAIPDVLLRAIRGETPAIVSHRACCSATLLLLHAPKGLQMGPWPSHEESSNCSFYLQVYFLVKNAAKLLRHCFTPVATSDQGPLFGDSIWNSIIVENFQLEELDNENLPCSSFLLAFLAELLENTSGPVVTDVDEKLLQELVIFYAQQPANPVPPGSPYASLQRIVDILSKSEAITFLTTAARSCIHHKLQMESYSTEQPSLPPLAAYKRILLPELLTNSQ